MKTLDKLLLIAKEKYSFNPIITKSAWKSGHIGQIDSSTIIVSKEERIYFISAKMKNYPDKIIILYDEEIWAEHEVGKWVCKDCGGIFAGQTITCICKYLRNNENNTNNLESEKGTDD
jgi:hypothetical protein